MKLTPEDTIIFIRLIKKYQLLWHLRHPDYGNREKQASTWEKIASYFDGARGCGAYTKYRRLRHSYAAQLKKVLEGAIPTSKLYYFEEMEFLRETIQKQIELEQSEKDKRKLEGGGEGSEKVNTLEEPDPECPFGESHKFVEIESQTSIDNNIGLATSVASHATVTNETFIQSSTAVASVPLQPTLPPPGPALEKQSEFDAFGVHVSTQLCQLDVISAVELMSEIQCLISQKRIHMLKHHKPKRPNAEFSDLKTAKMMKL